MPKWTVVAEGATIDGLQATVPNFDLPSGTPVKFTMSLNMPVAFLFDAAGVDSLFSLPEGLNMVDVHGEGWSTVVVDAKANSPTLAAVLAWVAAHWVAILIGGFILWALVSLIKMTAYIAEMIPVDWLKWAVLGAALYFGYQAISGGRTKKRAPP